MCVYMNSGCLLFSIPTNGPMTQYYRVRAFIYTYIGFYIYTYICTFFYLYIYSTVRTTHQPFKMCIYVVIITRLRLRSNIIALLYTGRAIYVSTFVFFPLSPNAVHKLLAAAFVCTRPRWVWVYGIIFTGIILS